MSIHLASGQTLNNVSTFSIRCHQPPQPHSYGTSQHPTFSSLPLSISQRPVQCSVLCARSLFSVVVGEESGSVECITTVVVLASGCFLCYVAAVAGAPSQKATAVKLVRRGAVSENSSKAPGRRGQNCTRLALLRCAIVGKRGGCD